MSAAEAVFHAKAPADKKASAQAAIRKRFLMVVIMGLLSGGKTQVSGVLLYAGLLDAELEMRNEKLEMVVRRAIHTAPPVSLNISEKAINFGAILFDVPLHHFSFMAPRIQRIATHETAHSLASQAMPLYVILIGMTSLFWMGFFFILLQLIRMKFVILLLPVFQLALGGLLGLRLLGILRRWILGARGVSEEGGAREGKT